VSDCEWGSGGTVGGLYDSAGCWLLTADCRSSSALRSFVRSFAAAFCLWELNTLLHTLACLPLP